MTTLVDMYARLGCVSHASFVFGEMPVRNVVSWSAMIACYAKNGKPFEALELFREMMVETHDSLPNSVTAVSVLQACAALAALEQGKLIHAYILRRGLDSVLPVISALITIYGVHGFGKKATQIFQEMIRLGVSPSPITFVSVVGACSHEGLVEEGKRLEEAAKIIDEMRIEPGPKVWGSLLGSSDIYAEAKMWDEVKGVSKLLETRSMQKVPGRSWIEVKRKMYSFISVDEFNPQIKQIQSLLIKISAEMKEKRYVPQTKVVLYDLDDGEKERILWSHSEKLAVAFGLINTNKRETIRIKKNLRLCEDCHSFTKFISKFSNKEILVRDVNRFHHFQIGVCSCGDYW
ncbi:hypothetical protein CRYUN_Cryun03dG0155400 [Craigia yunnanensis]